MILFLAFTCHKEAEEKKQKTLILRETYLFIYLFHYFIILMILFLNQFCLIRNELFLFLMPGSWTKIDESLNEKANVP